MSVTFRYIGVIHSPFTRLEEMPVQPAGEAAGPGTVEVFSEFASGLKDLAGFSHVILIYHLHQAGRADLTVTPFPGSEPRGVFATRAPARPNPLGLSVARLAKVEGATLYLEEVDILDGTPLLDIKPYVPEFDYRPDARTGWLEKVRGQAG
jgi:tRNA-Thr(GGU) m(6)t(6)A37 methyltransferase TsaA